MSKKRVAISTDDKIHISDHMGSCKYVAIYELDENDVTKEEFIPNIYTHVKEQSFDDEDRSHDRFAEALQKCDVVISRGIGLGLEKGFHSNGIDVCIVTDKGRLMQILFRHLQNQLTITTERICNCPEK